MISNGSGKKHEDEFPECIIKAFYHITPAVFFFFFPPLEKPPVGWLTR